MKEELSIPPGIRRMARVLGISTVIYEFLRLTFIGELISSALATRRRKSDLLTHPSVAPDEPILEIK